MGCLEENDQENCCDELHCQGNTEDSSGLHKRNVYNRTSSNENEDLDGKYENISRLKPSSADDDLSMWRYFGNEINLNKFLRFHPGGTSPLKECQGHNLGPLMKSTHHSTEAYYLLRDFYNGNSEERVVDWSKPMLSQVGRLGPLYSSWVWSPVDRPLRLFQYEWAEKMTRTNWKQVIGVWVPVIAVTTVLSFLYSPLSLSIWTRSLGTALSVVSGMAVWPLLEYSIHRWLFHLQPPKNSSLLITLHFGLHGLHHKVPFDEGRLLFPPGPCSVMALALYNIYTSLFPWWIGVGSFSGTMLGYLIYDLIHYYLHHGNPKEGSYLYYMKRYHNQHHFAQQEIGFGISSDFWDHAFNTLIKLKKLAKPLSWKM